MPSLPFFSIAIQPYHAPHALGLADLSGHLGLDPAAAVTAATPPTAGCPSPLVDAGEATLILPKPEPLVGHMLPVTGPLGVTIMPVRT